MEEKDEPKRRQITFDLGENKLKAYYPKPLFTLNHRYHKKAWKDIAKFMHQQGFEHRQYSVYASNNPMTGVELNALVRNMVKQMPWLNQCLNAIDVTDIGEQHSLMKAVQKATIEFEKTGVEAKETKEPNTEDKGMSMSEYKQIIAEKRSKEWQSGRDSIPQREKGKQSKDDRT